MNLMLSLAAKSPDYVLGFEAGKLWNILSSSLGNEVAAACHVENREVLKDIGKAHGWDIEFTEAGDGVWLSFVALRSDEPKIPNLRIVS